MRWYLAVALAALAITVAVKADNDDNAGRLLARASQDLMEMPLEDRSGEDTSAGGGGYVRYQVQQPARDDLAVSRLQDTLEDTTEALWETIHDPQLLRSIRTNCRLDKV